MFFAVVWFLCGSNEGHFFMQSPFKLFRKHQKTMLAILAVVAMVGFGLGDVVMRMTRTTVNAGAEVVVETSAGNLTQAELSRLRVQRRIANQFMFQAIVASHPEFEQFPMLLQDPQFHHRFGSEAPRELLIGWLLQKEAQQMGIVVDDQWIERFLDNETSKKLTTEQFRKILGQMRLGAKDLYDILRGELMSVQAYQLTVPVVPPSPEQYWRFYQQLNTRQKIEAAVLPVADFVGQVPDPSAAELSRFFDANKAKFPSAGNGEFHPGFRQPQRAKLQYLAMSYQAVEDQVLKEQPVTDKDIEEYYESKKDIDLRLQERGPASADADEPQGPSIDLPAAKAPAGDERPAAPANPVEGEASTLPCGDAADEKATDAAAEKSDTDKPDTDGTDKPAESDAEKAAATAAVEEPEPSAANEPAADTKAPAVRYKPLDDELRGVIRDSLLSERTVGLLRQKQVEAADALREVGLKFAREKEFDLAKPSRDEAGKLAERAKEEMKKIAERFGMEFGETKLVSPNELAALSGIGKVREPDTNDFMPGGARTIVDQTFASEALCRVLEGEDAETRDVYVYWKIEDSPVHVPTLDEPGIKEKVIEAWKLQQALPLARKRAEQLAELVRKASQGMSDVLAGQTVAGDAGGQAIVVRESPEFSWWKESLAPAAGSRQPQVVFGNPVVVPTAGGRFMQYVFDQLQEKEVGATVNDDASVYAIVRVMSRKAADREAFKDAPLFSPFSAYQVLVNSERQQAQLAYGRRIDDKYAVKWLETDEDRLMAMPPMDDAG